MRLLEGMNRHTCTDCKRPIPNGQAHIRSALFRQVAWCRVCLAVRDAILDQFAA